MAIEQPTARAGAWTDERITRLVRRHQRSLAAYLTALGCPQSHVPDILQEGFLALLRSGFVERDRGSTAAYLRRTVKNGFLKAVQRSPRSVELSEVDAAWEAYEGHDDGASYLEALRACLDALTTRTREVLQLRYGQDLSRAEIARRAQLSEGGVKSILLRGKTRLRECIERRLQ